MSIWCLRITDLGYSGLEITSQHFLHSKASYLNLAIIKIMFTKFNRKLKLTKDVDQAYPNPRDGFNVSLYMSLAYKLESY